MRESIDPGEPESQLAVSGAKDRLFGRRRIRHVRKRSSWFGSFCAVDAVDETVPLTWDFSARREGIEPPTF
jgi:hypothetical protein